MKNQNNEVFIHQDFNVLDEVKEGISVVRRSRAILLSMKSKDSFDTIRIMNGNFARAFKYCSSDVDNVIIDIILKRQDSLLSIEDAKLKKAIVSKLSEFLKNYYRGIIECYSNYLDKVSAINNEKSFFKSFNIKSKINHASMECSYKLDIIMSGNASRFEKVLNEIGAMVSES